MSYNNEESTFPKDDYSPKETALENMHRASEFELPLIIGGVRTDHFEQKPSFNHSPYKG